MRNRSCALGLLATDVDPATGGVSANELDAALWSGRRRHRRRDSCRDAAVRPHPQGDLGTRGRRRRPDAGGQGRARAGDGPLRRRARRCASDSVGAVRRGQARGCRGQPAGPRPDESHRRRRVRADAGRLPGVRRQSEGRCTSSHWRSWRHWASRSRSPPATIRASRKRSAPSWV